jgi:hypothetical protein
MSHFLRVPWLFAGPSLAARGALAALLNLDPSAQNKIADAVKEIGPPYSRKKMTDKSRQLHGELKVLDADVLYNILDAITDLVAMPSGDLPELLAEMFKDTGIQFAKLEALIRGITSDDYYVKRRAIQEFNRRALPTIHGFEHFCAMRTRFDKEFKYNEDSIENYNPTPVDYYPVVVFRFHGDTSDEILPFQLDQEHLDKLISELIAAQRQLKVVADEMGKSEK